MVINMDSHIASLLCMSTVNGVNIQTCTVFSQRKAFYNVLEDFGYFIWGTMISYLSIAL